MAVIPSGLSLAGTVLAISLAIVLLSGVALYVAFRLRETLREERGRGARVAKVAFLIGLLFLSGGVFYFFASGFSGNGGAPTQTVTSGNTGGTNGGSTSTTSATASASGNSTSTASTTSISTTSSGGKGVSMAPPQCPGQVAAGSAFTCQITIYNLGGTTFSNATVVSSGDFYQFTFVGCSESVNGGPSAAVQVSGHTVDLGSLVPGTTLLDLTVQAPSQPGQHSNSVLTLAAPDFSQPVSATFSIQVTH